MPAEARGPFLFPVVQDPDGRVLLRIHLLITGADRSHGEMIRTGFVIAPLDGGRPFKTTAVGPRQPSGPTFLKGEIWLPAGRFRIFPSRNPRFERRFDILPTPGSSLRIYCIHGARSPSWSDSLGAFAPNGQQLASIHHTLLNACCRESNDFRGIPQRPVNTRDLGFVQAISRSVRLVIGGRKIMLASGEGLVINRDETLVIDTAPPFPRHLKLVIVKPPAWERFLDVAGLSPFEKRFRFDPVPRPVPPIVDAAITGLDEAMRRPRGLAARVHLETCIHHYLFSLLRGFPNRLAAENRKTAATGLVDPRLVRAVAYLKRYYAQPYDRRLLAGYACISHQRLQELFRKHLRTNPRAYLQQVRMERAKDLLASGKRSLAEAGHLVGYADPRNFRRLYRRHMQAQSGDSR